LPHGRMAKKSPPFSFCINNHRIITWAGDNIECTLESYLDLAHDGAEGIDMVSEIGHQDLTIGLCVAELGPLPHKPALRVLALVLEKLIDGIAFREQAIEHSDPRNPWVEAVV